MKNAGGRKDVGGWTLSRENKRRIVGKKCNEKERRQREERLRSIENPLTPTNTNVDT